MRARENSRTGCRKFWDVPFSRFGSLRLSRRSEADRILVSLVRGRLLFRNLRLSQIEQQFGPRVDLSALDPANEMDNALVRRRRTTGFLRLLHDEAVQFA